MLTPLFAFSHCLLFFQNYDFTYHRHYDPPLIVLLKTVLWFLAFLLIIIFIGSIYARLRGGGNSHGHWSHHFENLQLSSTDFYAKLEEVLTGMKIPELHIKSITYFEGGVTSATRKYLRVSRHDMFFDICAAPFGTGFFLSCWQAERNFMQAFIRAIPFIGKRLERLFYTKTYYQLDTDDMFRITIHKLLLAAVDELTIQKGLRGVPELERKQLAEN